MASLQAVESLSGSGDILPIAAQAEMPTPPSWPEVGSASDFERETWRCCHAGVSFSSTSQAPCMEAVVSGAGALIAGRQSIREWLFLAEFEWELTEVVFECCPLPESGVLAGSHQKTMTRTKWRG